MAKELETKTFAFELKSFDGEAGRFSGYLSKFDVEDSYGDTVVRGAFKRTLKNKGEFPLLWGHNVDMPIGKFKGKEDAEGLLIDGKLTLGVQKAAEARELMLDNVLKSLSIGYQTVREEIDSKSGKRKLLEINLWEGSVCVFGACPGAEITEAKSDDPEEGDGDEPVLICEHCADALDEEPAKATPPEPQPIVDTINPEYLLHLMDSLRIEF